MKIATTLLTTALLLLGIVQHAWGQQGGFTAPRGQILGAVEDADTGDPISTATIAVWNTADSTLVTGAVATEDGSFRIEGLRPGDYYVQVSFVGYATQTISDVQLTPQQPQSHLGVVRLGVDTAMLDEVEITADRDFMEVHIDKNVYNVKDQLVSQGGSASDVLSNIPSIEVDIDGQISLRGSQNVAVLLNGRPSQMSGEMLANFLKGLPADAIESVEVIPNPSSRYEPDGMSGILNIVLKKDADLGLGGSLTAGTGTHDTANASGMVSFSKGDFSSRVNYGFRYGTRESEGTRFNEYRFDNPFEYLEVLNTGDRTSFSHNLNLNTDYALSKQNSLSLSGMLSVRNSDSDDNNLYSEWVQEQLDQTSQFNRSTEEDDQSLNTNVGLAFRRILEPMKHEFTAELDFRYQTDEEEQFYRQELLAAGADPVLVEQERNVLGEDMSNVSLQLDYIRPLGEEGKIEAGYKGSLQNLTTDLFAEAFDDETNRFEPTDANNVFDYNEQIHAAYGIVGQQFGALGAQVGVRVEQALTDFTLSTTDEDFENNYLSAFPSAFLTYKLSDAHQFRLSYSKRINRPRTRGWFNQLSPFSDRSDPLFRRQGNPRLKPEYIHSMELSYTLNAGKASLTMSPYFRRTVDVIRNIDHVGEDGVTTVTFENLDQSDSWGAEAIASLRLGRKFNAFASFNAFRMNTDASSLNASLSNDAFGWNTRFNGTLSITQSLSMQASWFYRAPMDVEQGRMGSMTWTNFAFRQQLMGDRASLSVRFNDPFGLASYDLERDTPTFYLHNTREFNARSVSLSLTYNFGQQDNNRRQNRRPQEGEGFDGGEGIEMGY